MLASYSVPVFFFFSSINHGRCHMQLLNFEIEPFKFEFDYL